MPLTVPVLDAYRVVVEVATNDAVIAAIEAQGGDGALTESIVTMTGASGVLVAADSSRTTVMVFNADSNAAAVIGLTGQTVSADQGMPLQPGDGFRVTGTAARSAMTQIGTSGQKLTVYVG